MATALCSKVIPEIGGDTCFCSMTAAYDWLSTGLQNFLSGLEAVHDFKPFKTLFAQDEEGWKRLITISRTCIVRRRIRWCGCIP